MGFLHFGCISCPIRELRIFKIRRTIVFFILGGGFLELRSNFRAANFSGQAGFRFVYSWQKYQEF